MWGWDSFFWLEYFKQTPTILCEICWLYEVYRIDLSFLEKDNSVFGGTNQSVKYWIMSLMALIIIFDIEV